MYVSMYVVWFGLVSWFIVLLPVWCGGVVWFFVWFGRGGWSVFLFFSSTSSTSSSSSVPCAIDTNGLN